MTDLVTDNLREETRMSELGESRARKAVNERIERGKASATPGGQSILRSVLEPFSLVLRNYLEQGSLGTGKHTKITKCLSVLNPNILSYLTLLTLIDEVVSCPYDRQHALKLNNLAHAIGYSISSEIIYGDWKKQKPDLFHKVNKDLKKRCSNQKHKTTVLRHCAQKYDLDIDLWPVPQRQAVGASLIFLLESIGLVTIKKETNPRQPKHKVKMVYPSNLLMEKITSNNEAVIGCSTFFCPTLIEPVPWTSLFGGGYHTSLIKPLPLMKKHYQGKAYWREFDQADMPCVYKAVNHLQSVKWTMNLELLDVMEEAWDQGIGIGKIPDRHSEPELNLPPKPEDISTNEEARRRWRAEASRAYTKTAKRKNQLTSHRIMASRVLGEGRRLAGQDIFLPWQMDFRGRLYPTSAQFSPQGTDYIKALFKFSEGKPVETQEQLEFLQVTGPGHYGYDKVSIADRVAWVKEHEDLILQAATDPLEDISWWGAADKPWQFLAWCFEWAGFLSDGLGFISHLPCPQDGSCNGIQHFAAMMRDKRDATQVNLLPGHLPCDVYQSVADEVIARLEESDSPYADQWLTFGITRKTVKRQVMTLPYGATRAAFKKYFLDIIDDAEASGDVNPFGEDAFRACLWMTDIAWQAVKVILKGAMEAMAWLQEIASIVAKANLPLNWTTPLGLPVQQAYRKQTLRQVRLSTGEKFTWTSFNVPQDDISPREQKQGVAPNFVHSLDACHLMMTVARCKDEGIDGLAMVHDSYATHAADSPRLATILREEFVRMYKENDVLGDFLQDIACVLPANSKELPEAPVKGDLDIALVEQSRFFFS